MQPSNAFIILIKKLFLNIVSSKQQSKIYDACKNQEFNHLHHVLTVSHEKVQFIRPLLDDRVNMEGNDNNCDCEWKLAEEEIDHVLLHMRASFAETFITVKGTNNFYFLSCKPEQKLNNKVAKHQEHWENHTQ